MTLPGAPAPVSRKRGHPAEAPPAVLRESTAHARVAGSIDVA
jgi:hypothetical protein